MAVPNPRALGTSIKFRPHLTVLFTVCLVFLDGSKNNYLRLKVSGEKERGRDGEQLRLEQTKNAKKMFAVLPTSERATFR